MTVIDANDPDWWKGKCLGKIGFFPSKYVAKLAPNEKPLQVTHNLQISETEEGLNKLLRDQVKSSRILSDLFYIDLFTLKCFKLFRLWYKLERKRTEWSLCATATINKDRVLLNFCKKFDTCEVHSVSLWLCVCVCVCVCVIYPFDKHNIEFINPFSIARHTAI